MHEEADTFLTYEMKVLGVVLDRRLSFDSYVRTVARACNYHLQAIRHIRHLLTTDLAVTLACSLILSRLDYCNAVLHEAPTGSIQKLQRVQNTAQPLLEHLHWLPVHQRIDYKLAVLTYKVRSTGTPSYLSHHIKPRISTRHLRSSSHLLLQKPATRTHFADRTLSGCPVVQCPESVPPLNTVDYGWEADDGKQMKQTIV